MPTVFQRRRCAEIRRFFQEDCKGLSMQDARQVIQKKFNLDTQAWHRIKPTLNRRMTIRDRPSESPLQSDSISSQTRSESSSEPTGSTTEGFEISIPSDLDSEAKESFNRILALVGRQSEQLMALTNQNALLEERSIKQSKTIQFLKSVVREMTDAIN